MLKLILLTLSLFLVASCSASPGGGSAQVTNIPASPEAKASVPQPKNSPAAVVADLYKQDENKRSPFFQDTDRAAVDKYFAKNLADLIWKDAVDSKGEVGALGADPLYNAQDTDIKNFSVHPAKIENGKAEVRVSFENFGKKTEIIYLLAMDKAEWKIEDIKYNDGSTLLKTLKG